ncbi:unnamed protein product [Blepharisma stoltei]|uniref:Uncharacterized protein n=1 Tax=Blepharisma stoltei TaxID=1481888 RepID=A0AAU9JFR9_9CILI|nr:unnamed protein product [Blepharisma stoltei]
MEAENFKIQVSDIDSLSEIDTKRDSIEKAPNVEKWLGGLRGDRTCISESFDQSERDFPSHSPTAAISNDPFRLNNQPTSQSQYSPQNQPPLQPDQIKNILLSQAKALEEALYAMKMQQSQGNHQYFPSSVSLPTSNQGSRCISPENTMRQGYWPYHLHHQPYQFLPQNPYNYSQNQIIPPQMPAYPQNTFNAPYQNSSLLQQAEILENAIQAAKSQASGLNPQFPYFLPQSYNHQTAYSSPLSYNNRGIGDLYENRQSELQRDLQINQKNLAAIEREKEILETELNSAIQRESSTALMLQQIKLDLKILETQFLDCQYRFNTEIDNLKEKNSQILNKLEEINAFSRKSVSSYSPEPIIHHEKSYSGANNNFYNEKKIGEISPKNRGYVPVRTQENQSENIINVLRWEENEKKTPEPKPIYDQHQNSNWGDPQKIKQIRQQSESLQNKNIDTIIKNIENKLRLLREDKEKAQTKFYTAERAGNTSKMREMSLELGIIESNITSLVKKLNTYSSA